VPARLREDAGGIAVELENPEDGVAPGQAAVFYDPTSTRVLGGGWIAATE
jgi:tRNA-specific 2-thiouridylase